MVLLGPTDIISALKSNENEIKSNFTAFSFFSGSES